MRENEDEETAIVRAQLATQILEGTHSDGQFAPAGEATTQPMQESSAPRAQAQPGPSAIGTPSAAAPNQGVALCPDTASGGTPHGPGGAPSARSNGSPSLEVVIQGAQAFGIDGARYEDYADRRWGSGWKLNVSGRRAALEEIERYRNDPDGYLDKIEAELARSAR